MRAVGSSPPARGTPGSLRRVGFQTRFIPARAGNTRLRTASGPLPSVHPRPRGEHWALTPQSRILAGSSPPARGTRQRRPRERGRVRFIPARAGNTVASATILVSQSVHPRPRGEHPYYEIGPDNPPGSSPPARGTPVLRDRARQPARFIPARAGNTPTTGNGGVHASVHPRPRGEHEGLMIGWFANAGSSPPARGTPTGSHPPACPLRFIPARAGNTRTCCSVMLQPPVHPRPRGEHANLLFGHATASGSSPPARGTLQDRPRRDVQRRFIPARAGNTRRWRWPPASPTVHPRPRGEHLDRHDQRFEEYGSSPPARGTPLLVPRRSGFDRLPGPTVKRGRPESEPVKFTATRY